MTKVELHKIQRPRPPGADGTVRKAREVWMLRWIADGKRYGETIGDCKTMSRRTAESIRCSQQGKYENNVESPKKPKRMTLAAFLDADRDAVGIDLRPRTLAELKTAAMHATAVLGNDFDIRNMNAAAVGPPPDA